MNLRVRVHRSRQISGRHKRIIRVHCSIRERVIHVNGLFIYIHLFLLVPTNFYIILFIKSHVLLDSRTNIRVYEGILTGWSCRSMVDRKITGLEVAGSSPVTITFYHLNTDQFLNPILIYICNFYILTLSSANI
jgi:hypothetical protein